MALGSVRWLQCGAPHCGGFSCFAARALERVVFGKLGHAGLLALRHMESSRTGIKPVCPALAGAFLSSAPPGKAHAHGVFLFILQSEDDCFLAGKL